MATLSQVISTSITTTVTTTIEDALRESILRGVCPFSVMEEGYTDIGTSPVGATPLTEEEIILAAMSGGGWHGLTLINSEGKVRLSTVSNCAHYHFQLVEGGGVMLEVSVNACGTLFEENFLVTANAVKHLVKNIWQRNPAFAVFPNVGIALLKGEQEAAILSLSEREYVAGFGLVKGELLIQGTDEAGEKYRRSVPLR